MAVVLRNLRCLLSKRPEMMKTLPLCSAMYKSSCKRCVFFSSSMSTESPSEPKVYITRTVPSPGRELLALHCSVTVWDSDQAVPRAELLKQVVGVDALFCLLTDQIDTEVLDAAGPQLKVVATMSVGYDHIDLQECKKRNIAVGNTPNVLTNATAELTVSLLLATSRRLKEGMLAVENGEWGTWKPLWLCGPGLDGATVGIVGLGRIGMAVAYRLLPFGVSKIVYNNSKRNPSDSLVGAEFVTLDKLLEISDYVIACLSLTPATKEVFNAEAFRKMKKSAIFINTSRGGIMNQTDLYNALKSGEIWAAGLDVTTPEPLPLDSPLLELNNCTVLPHIGSATNKARSTMADLTAQNILAGLQGKPLPCRVD
ncbi:glyoxylate reductase/hydroxypyruvate reductase-like [Gigantopelta aegis]|uniref:glyoxylate reductase/hydroxypyruvate reductase-like n=1 Tax=Gigantopelta aegis TaxID=1735272 RepID=UPI001B889E35|nr:glyoxylate reductase/hydroxypyruvate reductase-like [Gigantopelta aegis]